MLNYGYAILRAATARALAASGLLLALGIFHHNQYNPYCLADDMMEPYRPFVDVLVHRLATEVEQKTGCLPMDLERDIKNQLVAMLTADVLIEGQKSPLLIATQRTAASLAQCYLGERVSLIFGELA
jgi:CRISPR-associated protein Cas1